MGLNLTPAKPGRIQTPFIPANAGISGNLGRDTPHQIPACAGMTGSALPTQVGTQGGWLITSPAAMDPDFRQEHGLRDLSLFVALPTLEQPRDHGLRAHHLSIFTAQDRQRELEHVFSGPGPTIPPAHRYGRRCVRWHDDLKP